MVDDEKQYLLRFPTFQDVKFLDDNNPIESDISDDESIHTKNLLKCNGWTKLNPTGRNVYRLLAQDNNSIWAPQTVIRPHGLEDYLLRTRSPQDLAKIKKTLNNPIVEPIASSSGSVSHRDKRPSTSIMSSNKSRKRKREESVEDDVEHRQKKIAKKSNPKTNRTSTSDSSVDSSDLELSCDDPINPVSDINVQENSSVNDRETATSRTDVSSHSRINIDISDSEIEESTQDGGSQCLQNELCVGNSQTQGSSSNTEKDYQEHIFTQKDEEEISKFSSLLDPDVVKNNTIWILQCPTSMNCSGLVGQQINFTESSKIDVGNCSYESFSFKSKENRFATLAVPIDKNQLQLMRIPVAGNVIVEEYVDLTSDSGFSVTEAPRCVEMPENLQTRHPLFGKNYKKQIKMAKKMEFLSMKKEPVYVNSEEETFEESLNLIESPSAIKKKKKTKHNFRETNDSMSDVSLLNSTKKKKKRKKDN